LSGQKTTVTQKGDTTTTTRGSLGGGGDTLTMTQAVTKLKEIGVPYGGQAGSQLKDWDAIAKYFNTNIVSGNYSDTSPGTGALGNPLPKPGVIKAVSGTAGSPGSAASGLPSLVGGGGTAGGGTTGGGTGGAGATGSTVTGGGAGTGAGYNEASSRLGGGGSTTTKKSSTDYEMLDEPRFSAAQIETYRSFYGKMKGGKVAPSAALLSPYQGYGGPRSTAIGNSNTQTATKMLLGQ